MLAENTSLRTLELDRNSLGEAGASSIAAALKRVWRHPDFSLQGLNLWEAWGALGLPAAAREEEWGNQEVILFLHRHTVEARAAAPLLTEEGTLEVPEHTASGAAAHIAKALAEPVCVSPCPASQVSVRVRRREEDEEEEEEEGLYLEEADAAAVEAREKQEHDAAPAPLKMQRDAESGVGTHLKHRLADPVSVAASPRGTRVEHVSDSRQGWGAEANAAGVVKGEVRQQSVAAIQVVHASNRVGALPLAWAARTAGRSESSGSQESELPEPTRHFEQLEEPTTPFLQETGTDGRASEGDPEHEFEHLSELQAAAPVSDAEEEREAHCLLPFKSRNVPRLELGRQPSGVGQAAEAGTLDADRNGDGDGGTATLHRAQDKEERAAPPAPLALASSCAAEVARAARGPETGGGCSRAMGNADNAREGAGGEGVCAYFACRAEYQSTIREVS